jgi:subtilisin family serine protease
MHDVAPARPARARRPRPPGRFLSPMLGAALLVFCNGLLASTGVVRTPAAQIRGSAAIPGSPATTAIEIAPALQRRLAAGERSGFAIEFRERADLSAARSLDWTARGRYVYERLRDTAERTQAVVRRLLRERGVAFHAYWIKNTILVEQGDMQTLQRVAQSPGVARIRELPKAELIAPEHPAVRTAARPHDADGTTDNVAWIGADRAWNDGTTGDGVTVGIIDDGVFYRHEAIVQEYRGNLGAGGFVHDYNWYAPLLETTEPDGSQGQGHGTHVTGTVVGDNGAADAQLRRRTGVAPGARWIACLGLPIKGSEFALPACGEFMLAPTKTDGSAPNPDLRPQVVNNSWGSYSLCDGSADDFYRDVVEAWVAAGIFPVFAAGNAGNCGLPEPPGLSTVTSPASLGSAFAVGSTGNHDGAYAPHSLWGPGLEASAGLPDYPDPRGYPTMKPQVVAPGVDILSAIDGADGYATMTGTSMSAPHIAGLVALMLEAGECLRGDYAALGGILMQTARPIDYASGGSPPPGIGNLPNYATGWGEVDAPRAVDAAAHACGPQGFIRGRVASATGTPIAGAKIEVFVDENVRVFQATSGIDGSYVRRMPVDAGGGYTVRVSAYGYLPSSETGVRVQADATTLHDVVLATAPMVKVSGRVVDAATGWPLHAKITISGHPDGPVWSDPVSGRYSVRLPEGRPYRFDVASDVTGYRAASRELASVGAAAEQDFALDADLVACEAPGYTYASNVLAETFEDNGSAPPPGWSRSSAGLGWLFGDSSETSAAIFPIPAHGRFAAANDELGAGEGWDNDGRSDYLQMPPLGLALAHPVLRYRSYYVDTGGHARVEASTDGGASWIALGAPKSAYELGAWTEETLSLSAAAANGARLRFHSDDGSSESEPRLGGPWAIDDVRVVGACMPPASGGLVVGHVRDANTGIGLVGAEVRIAGGNAVATVRSDDPGVGDGFFAAHAPGGTPGVTATRGTLPAGYGDATVSANVTSGATSRADLALPAGRLRLYPAAPSATVELGTIAHASLTADNSGTAPLAFGFEGPAIEEHFEGATFPPAGWDIVTVGDGCPWSALDPAQAWNTAGGDGRAAMVDLYPCWGGEASDSALVSPPLDLSASHTASLGFFLSLFEGADNAPRLDIDASADGGATWTTVHSETRENNGSGPGALIELDLSAFAGASDVRVRFHYTGTPPWGSVIVDQVHLFESINANALVDITPDHGALGVGESRALDVLFDARELAQRRHAVRLAVRRRRSDDDGYRTGELRRARRRRARPRCMRCASGRTRGRDDRDPCRDRRNLHDVDGRRRRVPLLGRGVARTVHCHRRGARASARDAGVRGRRRQRHAGRHRPARPSAVPGHRSRGTGRHRRGGPGRIPRVRPAQFRRRSDRLEPARRRRSGRAFAGTARADDEPDADAGHELRLHQPADRLHARQPLPAPLRPRRTWRARARNDGARRHVRGRLGDVGGGIAAGHGARARAARRVHVRQPRTARGEDDRRRRYEPRAHQRHVRHAAARRRRQRARRRDPRTLGHGRREHVLSGRQQRRRERAGLLGRARLRHRRAARLPGGRLRLGPPDPRTRYARERSVRRERGAGRLARARARGRAHRGGRDPAAAGAVRCHEPRRRRLRRFDVPRERDDHARRAGDDAGRRRCRRDLRRRLRLNDARARGWPPRARAATLRALHRGVAARAARGARQHTWPAGHGARGVPRDLRQDLWFVQAAPGRDCVRDPSRPCPGQEFPCRPCSFRPPRSPSPKSATRPSCCR